MYRLKEEFIELFKEYRTRTYADFIKCDLTFASGILNASRPCKAVYAQAIISFRFDVTIRYIVENNLLEKYFTKEN